ncbi:MAG TPA: type II secretion system protein [Candidatus Paceibacterota bacterium]
MKLNKEKGFTLLETLVAVAIMMIAIGSAFGLAPEGLVGVRFAKNQTTATYLAQEAMEVARNIRDNSMFFSGDSSDPTNWLNGLLECENRLCTIDTIKRQVEPCLTECPPLFVRLSSNGSLVYENYNRVTTAENSKQSIFTREITIKKKDNSVIGRDDTEAVLTVKVRWKEGISTKTTEINETLFDWWTFNK